MREAGQVAIVQLPDVELVAGKRRPVLLLAEVPGPHGDWLVGMFSSQLQQAVPDFDEVIAPGDSDFESSGLHTASVIRPGRLAVVSGELLVGSIGAIGSERLGRMKRSLSAWISQ